MKKESLWTKDFILIFIINFFLALVFNLLIVTVASYAIEKFDASTNAAGFAASIFLIGALIGRLITGHIIGDTEGKKVLIFSLILNVIATGLYFGVFNLPLLLFNRMLHGFAFGMATTTTATMIAQILPEKRRGEGIGYFSMNVTLAQAIGPSIGIFLSHYVDLQFIFIFAMVLNTISLTLSLIGIKPVQTAVKEVKANNAKRLQVSDFIEPNAIPIAIVSLIVGIGYSIIGPFLSIYAAQIHLEKAAGFFFIVYAITVVVSRSFSGRLLDTKGPNIVLYPALFIFAAGMLLYSQASHGSTLLLAGVLIGLGYGNFHSCAQATAIKITPPHRYGAALATYYLFYESGFGIGPFLFGSIVPFTEWRNVYLLAVIVILADIVVYYFLYGRKEKLRNLRQQCNNYSSSDNHPISDK